MIEKGKGPLGKKGEQVAAEFLEAHGHTILQRNWRSGHLEIDLISEDDFGLHFVEVKSRTAPIEAAPEENVNPRKQGKITSAAPLYEGFAASQRDPREGVLHTFCHPSDHYPIWLSFRIK